MFSKVDFGPLLAGNLSLVFWAAIIASLRAFCLLLISLEINVTVRQNMCPNTVEIYVPFYQMPYGNMGQY